MLPLQTLFGIPLGRSTIEYVALEPEYISRDVKFRLTKESDTKELTCWPYRFSTTVLCSGSATIC